MMEASLTFFEPGARVAVLRVHPRGETYGGPFTWAVTVEIDGATAYLHAALAVPNKAERDAMRVALKKLGVKALAWNRRDPATGQVRHAARITYRTESAEE